MLFSIRLIMGYNNRNPPFSFRLGEYRTGKLNKLAKIEHMTPVDFLRLEIIDPFFEGKLIKKTQDDLTIKMQEAKLQSILLSNEEKKKDNILKQMRIDYFENFHIPMPEKTARVLKPQIITQTKADTATVTFSSLDLEREKTDPVSPYDEKNNRLACLECNQLFTWKNQEEFNDQLLEFQRHMTNKHEREINHFERAAIIDAKFLGASR